MMIIINIFIIVILFIIIAGRFDHSGNPDMMFQDDGEIVGKFHRRRGTGEP